MKTWGDSRHTRRLNLWVSDALVTASMAVTISQDPDHCRGPWPRPHA